MELTPEQIAELEQTLPPAFARTEVPRLLGGVISSGRLANLDSAGEGPPRFYIGRKAGYLRRPFIEWMRARSAKRTA
jgi:hypothetical protein